MNTENNPNSGVVDDLLALASEMNGERNLNNLLRKIIQTAKKLLNADAAIISLLDNTKRNLYAEACDYHREAIDTKQFPLVPLYNNDERNVKNVGVHVVFSGKLININDIYQYSGFDFSGMYQLDESIKYRTTSLLTVPLVDRKNITIGVLQLINACDAVNQITCFNENQYSMVNAFASLAAVAIANTQLIEENQNLIHSLDESNRALVSENQKLKRTIKSSYSLKGIIGNSPAIEHVIQLIKKVVSSSATVLIQGETGTGKELVAQSIHYHSPRKNSAFIAQNCAALPENLLESELFGYRKGAFTGADKDKSGLIAEADGGTLFLDEIADLSLPLQSKLLRVLQEKEVRPLGGTRSVKVDLRVIAATHKNIRDMIRENNFREDLFYRLNVFPITLPSLRERKDDIKTLFEYFIQEFNTDYQRKITGISPKALNMLLAYHYPGNIRELKNICERAVLLCDDCIHILPEHLPDEVSQVETVLDRRRASDNLSAPATDSNLKEQVEHYEANAILLALKRNSGNQSKTAKDLGIARRTLIDKINRYQISK